MLRHWSRYPEDYTLPIFVPEGQKWVLPGGAFGRRPVVLLICAEVAMLDFVFGVFGLGISTVLVRRSSRKGMDLELTWLQSLKGRAGSWSCCIGPGFWHWQACIDGDAVWFPE